MNPLVRVAAVQMQSTTDLAQNLASAERLVEQAVEQGAELVVLPELFPCLGSYRQTAQAAQEVPGPVSELMGKLAARLSITLLAGSMSQRAVAGEKCFNTSLLFDPRGELLTQYQKIHLFDVDLPEGHSLRESDYFLPGDQTTVVDTAVGRCGLAICYDLRFPELFRRLSEQRADLILIPAAFTATTGKLHWQTLVRTRAIENQAYVIAANQVGEHSSELTTYGHSMIVDPWGEVLAEAGDEGEEVILAELSAERLASIRQQFPALQYRRL
jgi:predicted amidohydrolase